MAFKTVSSLPRPVPLAQSVLKATAACFKGEQGVWAQICLHWEKIVGPKWAEVTCPTGFSPPQPHAPRGVLQVAFWHQEGGPQEAGRRDDGLLLSYEAPQLCARLNQHLGFGAVHQIKWKRLPEPRRGPSTSPSAPPNLSPRPVLSSQDQAWVAQHLGPLKGQGPKDGGGEEVLEPALETALQALGKSLVLASRVSRCPMTHPT